MNLPDLPPQHAKPLEIIHETRWMDALLQKSPAPAVSVPSIASYAGWRTSIAVRPEQILAAQDLVSRRYAWRGYRIPAESGSDPAGDEEGPRVMLLAQYAGLLQGTLTVR